MMKNKEEGIKYIREALRAFTALITLMGCWTTALIIIIIKEQEFFNIILVCQVTWQVIIGYWFIDILLGHIK